MAKLFPCLLLLTLFSFPSSAGAGWLLWRAGDIIPSPGPEKEASAEFIAGEMPSSARSDRGEIRVEILILGRQYQVENMMSAAGFGTLPSGLLTSAGEAVGDMINGGASVKFPPAPVFMMDGRAQALSFTRPAGKRGRLELYLWRLPFRTPDNAHAWAAAIRLSGDADCGGPCPSPLLSLRKEIASSKTAAVTVLAIKKAPSIRTGPRNVLVLTVKPA